MRGDQNPAALRAAFDQRGEDYITATLVKGSRLAHRMASYRQSACMRLNLPAAREIVIAIN
jgi:hypothetical protein